ncbi:hypothetical protein EV182_004480, partial [Spiromyces aspiralis]
MPRDESGRPHPRGSHPSGPTDSTSDDEASPATASNLGDNMSNSPSRRDIALSGISSFSPHDTRLPYADRTTLEQQQQQQPSLSSTTETRTRRSRFSVGNIPRGLFRSGPRPSSPSSSVPLPRIATIPVQPSHARGSGQGVAATSPQDSLRPNHPWPFPWRRATTNPQLDTTQVRRDHAPLSHEVIESLVDPLVESTLDSDAGSIHTPPEYNLPLPPEHPTTTYPLSLPENTAPSHTQSVPNFGDVSSWRDIPAAAGGRVSEATTAVALPHYQGYPQWLPRHQTIGIFSYPAAAAAAAPHQTYGRLRDDDITVARDHPAEMDRNGDEGEGLHGLGRLRTIQIEEPQPSLGSAHPLPGGAQPLHS